LCCLSPREQSGRNRISRHSLWVMRPLRRRSDPARVPKIMPPSGRAFLKSIPSSVAQCNPGIGRASSKALLDEAAQLFLFERDAVCYCICVRGAHGSRENSTEFSKESSALVATAIWNGDGLQGDMIEPMSYETVEGRLPSSAGENVRRLYGGAADTAQDQ
jgi:hypothetical protein